jgi:hypothetical protein
MGFLTRLFRITPRDELKGISLGREAAWEVSPISDLPAFLRALPRVLPRGSILYLEGGTPPRNIKAFLDARRAPEISHIAVGTIWPRPKICHLPATADNLGQLADLAERVVAAQVAVHLHAYINDTVLLEWYDALWKDPFYLSAAVSEDQVRDFCAVLSLTYRPIHACQSPDGL